MNKLLAALGGFIALGLLMWFGLTRIVDNAIDKHDAKQKVAQHDSIEAVLAPKSDSLRTVFVNQKVPYVVYRDRVIREHPTDTVLLNLVNKCDQLILTCEQRQRVDSARISNLQSEVKTLKQIGKEKPNRLSAFIIGGMDFIASQPLVQGGTEIRVVGPLHLTGFLQAARKNNQNDVETRGVVALRFNFH